jgi:hypothetical protein
MFIKYSKWPYNIPASSIAGSSKIYPNLDFWFENKPSGNPGSYASKIMFEKREKFSADLHPIL